MPRRQYVLAGTGYLRVTPSGFHIRAQSFFECADALQAGQPAWLPVRMFMYARATELSLKAFLLAKGSSTADVKRHGHDSNRILKQALARGLTKSVVLTAADQTLVRSLNEYYQDKRLEYFDVRSALMGFPGSPAIDEAQALVGRLVTAIGPVCNSEQATGPLPK